MFRSTCYHATNVLRLNSQSRRVLDITALRHFSKKIAIVGSGPAGFYTAQKLLKTPDIKIDIFEKLPVPFGLIRYGVAPDHQDVKNVIKSFTTIVEDNKDRVNFYGNVNFGTDVGLEDLADAYHAVVLCYGSAQDRLLNIEGEDSKNTISARRFVGWYNGSPDDQDLEIDLNCDTACIIGHGNVALDCARILLRPAQLDKSDITSHAQQVLARSKIKRIFIIGRRGPIQVSFTTKELRELIRLSEDNTTLDPTSVFQDAGVSLKHLQQLPRNRRRLTELLLNLSTKKGISERVEHDKGVQFVLKFLAQPKRIVVDPESGKVSALELQQAEYCDTGSFVDEKARPQAMDAYESIDCGLIIRSIGYKAVAIDKKLPLDTERGAILNTRGRIHGYRNLYCSGWLATGASGVIAGTLSSSLITSQSILEDIQSNELPNLSRQKPGYAHIDDILTSRNIQVVHFNDWLRIDEMERRLGAILGKNREKLVDVNKMLEVARGEADQKQVD